MEEFTTTDFQKVTALLGQNFNPVNIDLNGHACRFENFGYSKTYQQYYVAGFTAWGYRVAMLEDGKVLFSERPHAGN